MTAPQPAKDAEPQPPRRSRLSRDPFEHDPNNQKTEFGYGPGLVPKHLNGLPPSHGGVYMPKCPRVELGQPSPDLSVIPKQVKRPRGEARGYPGDRVG